MDTQAIVTCPICLAHLDAPAAPRHWSTHVVQAPPGEDAIAYTWKCECGPTMMTWADEGEAAAGLALHMQMRHNIPM
jgi:hypothetical protein